MRWLLPANLEAVVEAFIPLQQCLAEIMFFTKAFKVGVDGCLGQSSR